MRPTGCRIYGFGEFRLDADEHTLHRGEELVDITPRTFDLLLKLVENPGRLLQKETLMQDVWADSVVEEGNLNRTMSNLRKVLGEKPREDRYIQTVPRVGYRFIAPVTNISAAVSTEPPATVPPDSFAVSPESSAVAPTPVTRLRSKWIFPALIVALVLVLAGGLITWQRRSSIAAPKPSAPVRVPLRLTTNPGDDSHPRWTKDGRIRFFGTDANNQTASFIMNADGTGQSAVRDFANLKTGVWSPDGTKVVFQKPNENRASYLANADGSNEIALPFIRGNFDWSFDSKEIVYQRTIEENNTEIFIYTLATKQSRNITNNPAFDADPSFSPDNKQVVFVSNRNGNNDLYLLTLDASAGDPLRLTYNPADDSHPVFSPDGTAIAFTSDRNETADAYLLLTLTGSDVVLPLTDWLSSEPSSRVAGRPMEQRSPSTRIATAKTISIPLTQKC
jgi:TolB protein